MTLLCVYVAFTAELEGVQLGVYELIRVVADGSDSFPGCLDGHGRVAALAPLQEVGQKRPAHERFGRVPVNSRVHRRDLLEPKRGVSELDRRKLEGVTRFSCKS